MGKISFATAVIAVVSILSGQLNAQFLPQPTGEWWPGYPGTDELEDTALGGALARGDFNCDGYSDLAVGNNLKDLIVGGTVQLVNVGNVSVLYGGEAGLDADNLQVLVQGPPFVGTIEESDRFGEEVAAGDFDHDDCDDLAVGVPFEDVGLLEDAGAVQVFYGGIAGLGSDQLWTQDVAGVLGAAEEFDQFGEGLVVADFDGDTYDDLAIGVQKEAIGAVDDAGAVHVLFGSGVGLTATDNVLLYRGVGPIPGTPHEDESLGLRLAARQGENDTQAVLFLGVPNATVGGQIGAGSVIVVTDVTASSPPGFNEIFQGLGQIPGTPEVNDRFGSHVSAGDFDGNGNVDVAIGVRWEDIDGVSQVGAVNVVFFGAGAPPGQRWTRNNLPGPPLGLFENDELGRTTFAGDFDNDGVDDLTIHGRGDPVLSGEVHILYGLGSGAVIRQTLVDQGTIASDGFGDGLEAGQFLGPQTGLELVVGIPNKQIAGRNSGKLDFFSNLLIFQDGFESGDTTAWSSTQ